MNPAGQPGAARVDQEFFTAALADALARGESVWLRVLGGSMLPWLRAGARVCIRPAAGRSLRRGDIVLFWRTPGHPILHRVVRVLPGGGCECLGDAEEGRPEPVAAAAVLGVAKMTDCARLFYLAVHPARRAFNRWCRKRGLRLRHG